MARPGFDHVRDRRLKGSCKTFATPSGRPSRSARFAGPGSRRLGFGSRPLSPAHHGRCRRLTSQTSVNRRAKDRLSIPSHRDAIPRDWVPHPVDRVAGSRRLTSSRRFRVFACEGCWLLPGDWRPCTASPRSRSTRSPRVDRSLREPRAPYASLVRVAHGQLRRIDRNRSTQRWVPPHEAAS